MTDYQATHYDLDHEQRGKQMLVLDAWKTMASVVDNDVIASSKTKPLVSGIENPASTLASNRNVYTTIPIKPLEKYCNFLFENYINVDFEYTMNVTTSKNFNQNLPYYLAVYFPSTACIPSRLQLICGNSIIWTNQFQRYEACVSMASLPSEFIDKDEQYVSMNKLLRHGEIPGVYLPMNIFPTKSEETGTDNITFRINCNIDLNQLSPIFSNIPFVTNDMGDLRLRLFFENIHKSLCVSLVPLDIIVGNTYRLGQNAYIGRFPCLPGTVITLPQVSIAGGTANVLTQEDTITINSLTWKSNGFGVQICQSCFDVSDYSKVAIAKYIGEDNKLAIPTQTWSTVQSTTTPTATSGETIFQVSAYNIALISFIFPLIDEAETCLPNPFIGDVDIQLNSKSLTYIPYSTIDYRALKDTAQAFLNNDKYAFNDVLKNSLIPGILSSVDYSNNSGNIGNVLKNIITNSYGYSNVWLDDNNFVLALGLQPPNCFEKGMCVASSNPQSTQVRIKYHTQNVRNGLTDPFFTITPPAIPNADTDHTNPLTVDYGSTKSAKLNAFCLALQDCMVVLDYNPVIGACQSGSIVYAEPTII